METLAVTDSQILSRTDRFFRPELDVMRLMAFCMVFVAHTIIPVGYHSWIPMAIRGGAVFGVPVFFALSAFLITELMFREKAATGTVDLRAFYIRRVLRIWPLYFGALLFAFSLSHVAPRTGHISIGAILSYVLLAGNWHAAYYGFLPLGSGVLWSICVEEQFYLVWPALVRAGSRKSVAVSAIIAWIISQVTVAILCHRGALFSITWYNSLAQIQYFGIGAGLSVLLNGRIPNFSRAARSAMIIGGLLVFFCFPRSEGISTYVPYLMAGVGTALIFLGFLGMPLARWASRLRHLGKISYGLYIYHLWAMFLVVDLARRLLHQNDWPYALIFVAALPLTVAVAHLSYKYFEAPFLRLKERFAVIRSRPA